MLRFRVNVWLGFLSTSFTCKDWFSFDWFNNCYVAFLLIMMIPCIWLDLFYGFMLEFWTFWLGKVTGLAEFDILLFEFYADLFWKVLRSNIISTKLVYNYYFYYPMRFGKSRISLFCWLLEDKGWVEFFVLEFNEFIDLD